MRRSRTALLGAVGVTVTLIAGPAGVAGASPDPKEMTMVNVVKIKGIPWFNRMAVGDQNFAKRTGVQTSQEGGDDTSPEKQVQIVADLIPRRPTAITVVPNSPESLEDVLGSGPRPGHQSRLARSHRYSERRHRHRGLRQRSLRQADHAEPRPMHERAGQLRPVRREPDREDPHAMGGRRI